jgi:hypothetical protein
VGVAVVAAAAAVVVVIIVAVIVVVEGGGVVAAAEAAVFYQHGRTNTSRSKKFHRSWLFCQKSVARNEPAHLKPIVQKSLFLVTSQQNCCRRQALNIPTATAQLLDMTLCPTTKPHSGHIVFSHRHTIQLDNQYELIRTQYSHKQQPIK